MSYKPDEATLISFLYGELEGAEQRQVEQYLQSNPDERKRLEEWSFTREALGALHDKEVIAPPIVLEEQKVLSFWQDRTVRMSLGIAATMLFFLVAAKFLGLSASYSSGELRIGFGVIEKSVPVTQAITQAQVDEMIRSSLASNNEVLKASWNEDRKSMEESIQKNVLLSSSRIDHLVKEASTANQEQVKMFVAQLQDNNLKLMKDYMQLSSAGQKEYLEGLLVDFSSYLQEQRKQDLQFLQARVNKVEQNTDQFKQETEEILTSLITNNNTSSTRKN